MPGGGRRQSNLLLKANPVTEPSPGTEQGQLMSVPFTVCNENFAGFLNSILPEEVQGKRATKAGEGNWGEDV